MRTRNRLWLFLLVLVGTVAEVWRTTSVDDLDLRGHPWRDPDELFRIASRTRDVLLELLIRAEGRSPVAYLVLALFVAASFVLRARAHHVATAVPLPWRGAETRARLVWGGALMVAVIPQVPVVPAFALCAVAVELGFRLRFRELLGALRRGRAPGFELEPASGDASSSVPIQHVWGRGDAELLTYRAGDARVSSYRAPDVQVLLRIEHRWPRLVRVGAAVACLAAVSLVVAFAPAVGTPHGPEIAPRQRDQEAAAKSSPDDPRRMSLTLGECLDEATLARVPEIEPAPQPARDGAFYVRWIDRAEPGPPLPEDGQRATWDTSPKWGAYVRVDDRLIALATGMPHAPQLLTSVDPTVLTAYGVPSAAQSRPTPSWHFVAVGDQAVLVEVFPTRGRRDYNYGCAKLPLLRPIARFVRRVDTTWIESSCTVHANDAADVCGDLDANLHPLTR